MTTIWQRVEVSAGLLSRGVMSKWEAGVQAGSESRAGLLKKVEHQARALPTTPPENRRDCRRKRKKKKKKERKKEQHTMKL